MEDDPEDRVDDDGRPVPIIRTPNEARAYIWNRLFNARWDIGYVLECASTFDIELPEGQLREIMKAMDEVEERFLKEEVRRDTDG